MIAYANRGTVYGQDHGFFGLTAGETRSYHDLSKPLLLGEPLGWSNLNARNGHRDAPHDDWYNTDRTWYSSSNTPPSQKRVHMDPQVSLNVDVTWLFNSIFVFT